MRTGPEDPAIARATGSHLLDSTTIRLLVSRRTRLLVSRVRGALLLLLLSFLACAPARPPRSDRSPAVPPPPSHRPDPGEIDAFALGVAREMNAARTRPADFAAYVESWEPYFRGNVLDRPGHLPMRTKEGVSAVREAAGFLRSTRSVASLAFSDALSRAAADHVRDQGPRGDIGHVGSDGSQTWDRISRYGDWSGSVGEDIWYGLGSPRDIVISLIVDDGIPDRGHRENIFDPEFRLVGVGWGGHAGYDSMTVIDFASQLTVRRTSARSR